MSIGNRQRRKDGQALIEFALVIPLLVVLLLGLGWFGLLFSWKHVLNDAARSGARAGAVCQTDAAIRALVKKQASSLPNANSVVVTITTMTESGSVLPADSRSLGGPITVTASYTATGVFIPSLLMGDRTLVSAATFRMECNAP